MLSEGTEARLLPGSQAVLRGEGGHQVWQICVRCKAVFSRRCSQVLPEGTEARLLPGSQAVLRGESSRQVRQTCVRCKALLGRCRSQMLPEGTEAGLLPESREAKLLPGGQTLLRGESSR